MKDASKPAYALPKQLEKLLAMVSLYFGKHSKDLLRRLVVNGKCHLQEGYDYDNWNGGQHGHALYLRLPASLYFEIVDAQNELASELVQTLNRMKSIENEHISVVFFEAEDDPALEHWREQSGVLMHATPITVATNADELHRVWDAGLVRLFLSHKATFKKEAAELKQFLFDAGISAFVAHSDIEPTREWQAEIERALFSMDALATLLTADFHESNWTDQEVGVAIGRNVPIVPVRFGRDPYGFFGKYQAATGHGKVPYVLAGEILELLLIREPLRHKLTDALIHQFASSANFREANNRMDYLSKVTSATTGQITRIEAAFEQNAQVSRAYVVQEKLPSLISRLKQGNRT